MIPMATEMFFAGLLLLLGIVSSKFSARLGMPVLVMFLAVGMLAGSEGIGGIPFEDYALANNIGSAALALILFDGGLRTSWTSVRAGGRPALVLSTAGVVVTAALTGIVATVVLELPVLQGLLLGAIVGSTDAAAVFSVLRSSGLRLPDRLTATLEVESGSNDPMAIFLTLALIAYASGAAQSAEALLLLFALQFGVGAIVGLGTGRLAAWAVNRIDLKAPALYPLLVVSFGFLAFGIAALLDGSGFLAVYVAGIALGNSPLIYRRGIWMFHDAAAWLSQIILFVMLGLLSFPSRLVAVAASGSLVALALIFVARPAAIATVVLPFGFRPREATLLAWGGLKGAVPITLATFPLLAGVEHSESIFDIVFFVVLMSALVQGWSLPLVARKVGLAQPTNPSPPLTVEVHSLRQLAGDIVDYTVGPSTRVAGRTLRELALPVGVAVALVVRDEEFIVPRGSTTLQPGDHAFVALHNELKPLVDALFDGSVAPPPLRPGQTLRFNASTTIGQLSRFLGITDCGASSRPLSNLFADVPDGQPAQLGGYLVAIDAEEKLVLVSVHPEPVAPKG